MEWMLKPYRKLYALIEGRASRQEFWMFVLLNVIVVAVFFALIATLIGGAAFAGSAGNLNDIGAAMAGVGMVTIVVLIVPMYIWLLLTAVASFAVTIRRFHDLNLSGWVYLPFLILGMVPLLNFLVWIALIVVMCLKGTSGPNKYGDDPTQPTSAAVFA